MSAPSPAVVVDSPQENAQSAAKHEPPRPFSKANLIRTVATGYLPLILATLVVFLPLALDVAEFIQATRGDRHYGSEDPARVIEP